MRALVGVAAIALLVAGCGGGPPEQERERAIAAAQQAYEEAKAQGVDFSSGPCIADPLIEDWVADVAHDPRQEVDDDPANQCAGFREGEADHFVELDPEGELIRAK